MGRTQNGGTNREYKGAILKNVLGIDLAIVAGTRKHQECIDLTMSKLLALQLEAMDSLEFVNMPAYSDNQPEPVQQEEINRIAFFLESQPAYAHIPFTKILTTLLEVWPDYLTACNTLLGLRKRGTRNPKSQVNSDADNWIYDGAQLIPLPQTPPIEPVRPSRRCAPPNLDEGAFLSDSESDADSDADVESATSDISSDEGEGRRD
ncbi:hypothetical protein EDC01DRAFT_658578 [Geopyxis carbonaria]|nr:hypothetical protein EDC01DRAFT_658578 [Geopyxis carbonaria]